MSQDANCNQRRRRFWCALLVWCAGLVIMAIATKWLVNSGQLVDNPWGIFGVCIGWWLLGLTCMLIDNYRRSICCGALGAVQKKTGFWNSVLDFKGRATRSQFWCGLIGYGIVMWVLMIAILFFLNNGMLALVACLVFLIPLWALFVRRLHDVGASGWWTVIPCIGAVVCVVSWFVAIFWGISWYFADFGLDLWGILIYLLSAIFIGLMPSKNLG